MSKERTAEEILADMASLREQGAHARCVICAEASPVMLQVIDGACSRGIPIHWIEQQLSKHFPRTFSAATIRRHYQLHGGGNGQAK